MIPRIIADKARDGQAARAGAYPILRLRGWRQRAMLMPTRRRRQSRVGTAVPAGVRGGWTPRRMAGREAAPGEVRGRARATLARAPGYGRVKPRNARSRAAQANRPMNDFSHAAGFQPDTAHSRSEMRYNAPGVIGAGRRLRAAFTWRNGNTALRVRSARNLNHRDINHERKRRYGEAD